MCVLRGGSCLVQGHVIAGLTVLLWMNVIDMFSVCITILTHKTSYWDQTNEAKTWGLSYMRVKKCTEVNGPLIADFGSSLGGRPKVWQTSVIINTSFSTVNLCQVGLQYPLNMSTCWISRCILKVIFQRSMMTQHCEFTVPIWKQYKKRLGN